MKIKVVIIGGGVTGMFVASELLRTKSKKAYDIHVYQIQNYISFDACGIPYYISNEFKNIKLLEQKSKKDYSQQNYGNNKITIHLNHDVKKIDVESQTIHIKNLKQKKLKIIKYHTLVIATGAVAKVPSPFSHGALPQNVFNVFTKNDAINLKKALATANKITIISDGGFIGLEMAETCLKLKKDVTIIEASSGLMSQMVDHEFSQLIYDELTIKPLASKKPIKTAKIFLNHQIEELMMTNNKVHNLRLRNLNDAQMGLTIACDLVILAVGFVPNTQFLQNNNSFELNTNGAIIINDMCQVVTKNNITNTIANIYSGGNCVQNYSQFDKSPQYIPLATNATKMAHIIALNIENENQQYNGTLGSSIVRIGKLEIAKTGSYANININKIGSIYVSDHDLPTYLKQSQPLYLKLFYHKTTGQLLAAHMAGYNHATLRINALAVAIWNKMKISDLQHLDLVYAPTFARTNDIIHIASRKVKS